jgi:hypothetical protein
MDGHASTGHGSLLHPSFIRRREVADVTGGPYLSVGPLPDIEEEFMVGHLASRLRIIE